MKLFWKLMRREFVLLGTNRVAVLIFIGAPILYAVLIGSVYKEATVRDLPIVVVDYDNTPLSNKIIDALDDNQYIKVQKTTYSSENIAHEVVEKQYVAVVTIPDRFEADIQQKRHPELNVDINGANMLTANYASTGIQTVLSVLNAGMEIESIKKAGKPQAIAEEQFEMFRITMSRHYNSSSNYLYFLLPGMLGTIMQQVFLLALALSFAKEVEENTFRNLLRYSKSTFYILMVKSLPYFIMGLMLWMPLIRSMFPLFQIPFVKSPLALWTASSLFMLSVTFLGIAVSILFSTQLKATEVLMVIATPSFIISGQTWPLSQMPQVIQYLSSVMPLTHFLEAFRKIILLDASITDILPELQWLICLTSVSFITAFFVLKYRIAKTR